MSYQGRSISKAFDWESLGLLSAQAFPIKVYLREITQTESKEGQQSLHAKHRLDLIYMTANYHQNISKGVKVIDHTGFDNRRTDRQMDGQS